MLASVLRKQKPLPAAPDAAPTDALSRRSSLSRANDAPSRQRKRDILLFRSSSPSTQPRPRSADLDDDRALRAALAASCREVDAQHDDAELETALNESRMAVDPVEAQLQADTDAALAASLAQPQLPPGAGHAREKDVEHDELEAALELSLAEYEDRLAAREEQRSVSGPSRSGETDSAESAEAPDRTGSPAVWFASTHQAPVEPAASPAVAEHAVEAVNEALSGAALGHGVRFGHPASCAALHACEDDGLRSHAPFPTSITLRRSASDEGAATFAIEASTWAALLRLMSW